MTTRCSFLSTIAALLVVAPTSANIYEWQYTPGSDIHRESTTLCYDGAGVDAVPFANLDGRNLYNAYLKDKNLTGASAKSTHLYGASLIGANLTNASLQGANLEGAYLTNTNFTNANITGAHLNGTTAHGFSQLQLYSTASYQLHDLSGMDLGSNYLATWNFSQQNLSGTRSQNYSSQVVLLVASRRV